MELGVVWPRGECSAHNYLALMMHSVLGGFLEHAPPGKIFKFRPYESASEAVGDHHHHAKFIW